MIELPKSIYDMQDELDIYTDFIEDNEEIN